MIWLGAQNYHSYKAGDFPVGGSSTNSTPPPLFRRRGERKGDLQKILTVDQELVVEVN